MSSRLIGPSILAVTVCVLTGLPDLWAAAPRKVLDDVDRILRNPELLSAVASVRLDAVLDAWEDPAWGGILDREIYSGLSVSGDTKEWLTGPEAQSADEVMPLAAGSLYQIEEELDSPRAQIAVREVSRNVVAADLADRLLTQLQGHDARLREIVRVNLGLRGPPVAALALRRLEGPSSYFRTILKEVNVLEDPWPCAEAAKKFSPEWRLGNWLPTLSVEQLLRVAQPYGPFDRELRREAIEELHARAPHTDWANVVSQQESDLLVAYLSNWLSEPVLIRLPPVDLVQEIALQVVLSGRQETRSLHRLLLVRALNNSVLGKAVLSLSPETLAPTVEVTEILAEVTADPEFFLRLLKKWDVVEQELLVAAALERIRARPEVSQWLATLDDDELEYVATDEEGVYPTWISEASHARLSAGQRPPPN